MRERRSSTNSNDASWQARRARDTTGGSASVSADDTIGAWYLCWCGEPSGHNDWPGAAEGAPHPR